LAGALSRVFAGVLGFVVVGGAYSSEALAQTDGSGSGAIPRGTTGASVRQEPSDGGASRPQVTMPELLEFVSAPYPAEAQKQGLAGNVVLQLDISATGEVTAASVVTPAGHGFDEAAVAAALKFRFSPATKDGTAVAARILYQYRFTLQVAAPPVDAPPPPRVPVRNLAGQIRTSDGDIPMAGATVLVRASDGSEWTTTTGEDGAWGFEDLPVGTFTVRVSAAGFVGFESQEQVDADHVTEVVYRVAAEGVLEVVIRGKRPPREVTKRTIEKDEIAKIPGTSGDALRSVENMPGVARSGFAGMLVVRGSSPGDTAVYMDGIDIPLVYHFGGLSSVIPTEMLERIDFYPGNFSTQYGRVKGGIVDVGIRAPRDDGKYHGMGQFDLIDMRAMLEGPVPFLDGWTFALAGRRSWFDVWLKPVLTEAGASVTAAPVYYDYQAILETKPTRKSSLRFGFIASDDRLEILTRDVSEVDPVLSGSLRYGAGFWRAFGRYENEITENLRFRTVLSVGREKLELGVGSLYLELTQTPVINRTELSYKVNRRAIVNTGIDFYWAHASINALLPPLPEPGQPDSGPYVSKPPIILDQAAGFGLPAAYVELELTPHDRLRLVPGVRVDYLTIAEIWDVSPRVNGRYELVQGFPSTALKAGVGLFHQPPDYTQVYPPLGTPGVRSSRSTHYSVGFEQELTEQVDVSVEGFYKRQDLLVSSVPSEMGLSEYANLGKGYVIGSEMMLRYKPSGRFFGWIAYTLSRSMLMDRPGEAYRLMGFDQTHIFTALGSYKLGRGWGFGARFRLVTGNLETPIVGSMYSSNSGTYTSIDGVRNSMRNPMFNQLDLRVDKEWKFDYWKLSGYLDIQNVYYSQNVEGYDYNYNYSLKTIVTGLPIIPSIGIRGDF